MNGSIVNSLNTSLRRLLKETVLFTKISTSAVAPKTILRVLREPGEPPRQALRGLAPRFIPAGVSVWFCPLSVGEMLDDMAILNQLFLTQKDLLLHFVGYGTK
ncbi:hypothetical protein BALCAV_0210955 [Alkalihalobacillus alcalophilus ATCC 27647 = CGMCC 1.3604]|uniref:Uncharacterized protein n=1 Tax=Alkalihalobacillus alcalophilus ATCC 27647 = CGMCC 1.3604 TaxID=1218173 RepID=A0A094XEY7_ALKAL|nr:hypothetical protein BALCAV_0210955 [Alkalihalobacillus alcalophilus ATCC 27647 = CGMCC 1.3604]